jgi:ABC-type dipeptide/oligopeptide/nickel transport system ATPase component
MNTCLRVMGGQFVETGPVQEILQRLSHPYTQELLAAVPEVPAK